MVKHLIYNGEIIVNMMIADTFTKRFFGYMFRKKPHHEAILIDPCSSIHTFFMKFNIDVLFVDENMRVVGKLEALKAGKVTAPVRGAKMVIEGCEGSFKNIEQGDILIIQSVQ